MTPEEVLLAKELADRFAQLSGLRDKQSLALYSELKEQAGYFEFLYEAYPITVTKKASRHERDTKKLRSPTLVYGEIHFMPFAEQLMKIKTKYGGLALSGGTFVDIGSGSGRPCFAAALLHDFDRCVGIEILQGLHEVCLKVKSVWDTKIKPQLPPQKQQTAIDFLCTDFTKAFWADATVVFANSTCFSPELMEKLAMKADSLKEGTFFITTTKKLPSKYFELLEQTRMKESWGDATCFIYRRLPDGDEA